MIRKQLTLSRLKEAGEIDFSSDDHEMTVTYGQLSSWDLPYKIRFNGELSSYRSFSGLIQKVSRLSEKYGLVEVKQ